MRYWHFLFFLWIAIGEARSPEITSQDATAKINEIMKFHAKHKALSPLIARRILTNYLEILDPIKTYFLEEDIKAWSQPSDASLEQLIADYRDGHFHLFEEIQGIAVKAILRKRALEGQIDLNSLPSAVSVNEFKENEWAKSPEELLSRLTKLRSLRLESASKLSEEMKTKAIQRMNKREVKREEEILAEDPERSRFILTNVLKATSSALDSHTHYFTPKEASQFLIEVQHRLFGIGALLRDDITGLTITKIVEGGPAAINKQIKLKDRIIAVNGEPIVGMDISDAIQFIRGEEHTPVVLTVIRETNNGGEPKREEKLDITLVRGEVVIKEARFKCEYQPFGDGAIGYVKLGSFYQDRDSSSAADLARAINDLKRDHRLQGLILDLRYNSGGLLVQAAAVTGLFITKGVVVSIKDEEGHIQHLRDLDGTTTWNGPLIILVNRASASASEIVAQSLQDYGRGIVVGDPETFGKGSFQRFTLTTDDNDQVDPTGEYKVTRGCYYTVSGKTPQLTGVLANVVIPGLLSESELGERYAKYPLENDQIKPSFDDDLGDIPFLQREKVSKLYKQGLQEREETYVPYFPRLRENVSTRLATCVNHQNMLREIVKKDEADLDHPENYGQNDIQLEQTYATMKDLLMMMQEDGLLRSSSHRIDQIALQSALLE